MTVWRKLDDEDCYAVALYNFNSPSSLHLPLEVGELVHLERETDDWYWGTSLRREAKGAFPKGYVVIRSSNVDRCGETVVASSGGSGVVHDIAVTLREWLQHWKILYTTNDDRFKFMEVSMRALLELRAQAASGALPQDQLRRVARTAVFTIDKGNRTLGMELAVRTMSGQLVDPLTTSTFKLNALHDEANSRIDKNMETTPTSRPTSQTPAARTYTIVVYIKNFVCRMSDTAELSLALHDSGGNKITENVLLKWPPGHLGAAELFTAPSVVFTDLGSDIKKEKIFLVCHVVRIGSMEPQVVEHRRSTLVPTSGSGVGGMRRPFGLASADITQHLAADNSDKEILLPFYPCEKDNNMDTLLKKVIANRELKDKHSQGLWVFLQMVEGDLKQIRQENPHMMVGNTAFARKMGFPEVILPGDARNDLYVTLLGGAFSRGPGKTSERNVELTARVVDRRGAPVPGVISVGAGVPLVNEYTSIVYYHEERPRWNEVFKVCLNIEEFKEAHIVFLCRHRSSNEAKDRAEKYFAMSYLRLMQKDGTTTPDTQHNLAVYKLEHKKCAGSAELEAGGACVALPSLRDELPAGHERGVARGPLALLPRDSLCVATKLCSTKLTQREEILGVLKWSAHHAEGTLRTALTKLLRVPNDELVKFLQDILDALFSILTQVEENTEEYTEQSYAVLVLDCLLQVISLVADHKYQHFQPVLHVYIERSFCDALAYEKLISIMVWTIRSAEQGEVASKRLLQCMKCLESLSRVLVRSWQLRAALGSRATALSSGGVNGTDEPTYCPELQSLLEALVWLMRCGDHALTCQGSALKYLPHAAPHLTKVFPDTQLSKYTVWALEALPLGRLSNQRLHALLELVRGPLGAAPGPRAYLLPHLAATLAALLVAPIELDNHKSRSAGKAARLLGADTASLLDHTQQMQIVELCVETLGEVVSLLARDDVGPVEADRGELARSLLPTVLRIAATMMKERNKEEGTPSDDPLLRKLICVLLDMVRQMSEEQYVVVMKSLDAESSGKANTLVSDALALMMALLQRPVFRPHWADMLHLQHYVMLHALRLLSTTLREQLVSIDDSDPEVVSAVHLTLQDWFNTLGAVASSPPIQLETLPTSRRQRATMLYGDIRRKAATLLANMWFSLEEHKRFFIPHLVGTFLEVSFLRVEEVRNIIIPLFFDMMQTEYKHTSDTEGGAGNMRAFENALIDKLDVLAEAGRGDAAWRASFVSLCGALAGAARLPGGPALVAAAARQLDALLQYRAAPVARRLYLVSGVLRFYEQIERPHMYIRYVHRLAALHAGAAHAPEAGLTLCLHAKLLLWSDEPLPPRLRHPTHPQHDTHFQLKSALYTEAVALLEEGRQWELAVRLARELVRVCDERGAAHGTLAALHEQLARLHRLARAAPRPRPVYFRVRYLGRGFPPHLRHPKGFVYRGNDCDMLHNFKERMLDEWPEAEVLLKLDEPGEDITESDGQYLQINAVTPIIDDIWMNKFGKTGDEQIIRYYEHNNVKKFVFSRPFHRQEDSITDSTDDLSGANEFATRWLERTELEISDTLPGILRWFPVVSTRTYWVCPLEVAVETMEQTNKELKAIIQEAKSPDAPLHPLTMRLQGILDSAVQGGLVHYERAFLTAAYEARRPQHAALLQRLRDHIADQVPLLKHGLDVHASREPVRELHAHLAACFRRVQHHVHQRYGRRMCEFETESISSPEVTLRTNLRDSAEIEPRNPSNRISDISTGNETTPKSKFKLNSAINWTRNSSSGTLTPRHKKRSRKSEVSLQSSGSQWYTSNSANGNIHSAINNAINSAFNPTLCNNAVNSNNSLNNSTVNNNSLSSINTSSNNISSLCDTSASPLRELRQELVCSRPQRSRASLPPSETPSNRDSLGTTDSNQDDEEPPPLPQKQSHRSLELDAENNNQELNLPVRHNYDLVISPRNSYLYQSRRRNTCEKLPPSNEKAPTPPPKKRNQNA